MNRGSIGMNVIYWLALCASLAAASATSAAEERGSNVPQPLVSKLEVIPPSFALEDGRDSRGILVIGKTSAGQQIDLTGEASISSDSAAIRINGNSIEPRAKGEARVVVKAAGLEAIVPIEVLNSAEPPVRFVRDVLPVLSKVGCNAGTCHGSANGKNGFKLSLRGYDPAFDYQALVNDISGRRFNRVNVDQSLMLLKPTAEVPHEGGKIFSTDSREYKLLRDWIAQGAKFETPATARANRIEVLPPEIEMALPEESQTVIVLAHYPDGTTRDVTRDAVISSNNEEVASVHGNRVTGVRRGEAAILIRYEGNYATQAMRVMGDRNNYEWVDTPEFNYVDQHVHAKLRKMKILPSDLCSDTEFIRRVSLDLTGLPPKPDAVRAFLADETPGREKRARLIEELLESDAYTQFWANKWADLLQCNAESLGIKGVWQYRNWIRNAIAANKPYDEFVRELLLATGSSYQNPAANYYRVLREPEKIAEDVSQTFLGVRFNCNKCHDHPFERWTQDQYYEFAAYFSKVAFKAGALGPQVIKSEAGGAGRVYSEETVYLSYEDAEVEHPKHGRKVLPKVPFGTTGEAADEEDRRATFVDWLVSPENPLFAKAMANRVWSYFFGLGIIDPVDDIRAGNPPSNGPLLDALTKEFVDRKFNLRQLMRTICNSRTYQLSFIPNRWNGDDKINFSHAQPRRLSAEQLYDAVAQVTGAKNNFAGLPKGMRAVEIADGKIPGDDFLSLFGRPKRQTACECERSSNLTLSHAMNLINGSTIGDAVSAPGNAVELLVNRESDNRKVVEELYYLILNRPPNESELKLADFSDAPSRLEGAQDVAWALLNSPAFLFNR